MNKADIQAAFVAAGVADLGKDIDQITQPSIRLSTTPVDESTLKIGESRLGGVPDLPPDVNWPEWKGLPHSFLAQIHLDEISHYDTNKLLPPRGMLWFFYDAQQQTFGADPADRGGWQVIFKDSGLDELRHTPAPAKLPASSQFKACSLTPIDEVTVSQQPSIEIPTLNWTNDEQQKYESALSDLSASDDRATPQNRLLGYADSIQDDVRLQSQLASNGVIDGNDPRMAELSKGTQDWQLLFQIDSDEGAGMRWSSSGMLYYTIKKADLQAHRFDDTWLVLQSE
jgi:uncharacterized protein YwqG